MSDRRRRRPRRARDRDREPFGPREDRLEHSGRAEPARDETPEDGGGAEIPDAVAEYERRRDELLAARRREREDRDEGDDREPRARTRSGGTPNPAPRRDSGSGEGEGDRAGFAANGTFTAAAFASGTTSSSSPSPRRSATAAFLSDGDADDETDLDEPPAAETVAADPGRRTPIQVRRDGPAAWAGRGYRRFRRGLKANLTAYGHRYNSTGNEGASYSKPFLLTLIDLPRLTGMWVGHLDYRATRAVTLLFRELRERPPRIEWHPSAETLTPLVMFTVPGAADLDPIWRWPKVNAWLHELRTDWRVALGGLGAAAAAAAANAKAEAAADLAAVSDRASRGLAWTQTQASRFDRLFGRGDRDRAWWFACGTGLAGLALTSLLFFLEPGDARADLAAAETGRPFVAVRTPAPDFDAASDPGDPGNVPDAALRAPGPEDRDPGLGWDEPDEFPPPGDRAADEFGPAPGRGFETEPEPNDPEPIEIAGATSADPVDPLGGRPDPFAGLTEEADDLGDPGGAGVAWGSSARDARPSADLLIGLERAGLPPGEVDYVPPDDDTPATARARRAGPFDPSALDPGGWLRSRFRDRPRSPRLPPEYVGADPADANAADPGAADPDRDDADRFGWNGSVPDPGAAGPVGDRFAAADVPDDAVPTDAGFGLRLSRRPVSDGIAAGGPRPGRPYRYELWVENDGDAAAVAGVEEAVGPGVRVTDADPPAEFVPSRPAADGSEVGGGTLRWPDAAVPPGGARRLTVTVVPLPGFDPAVGGGGGGEEGPAFGATARVLGAISVASATSVVRPEPDPPAEPDWLREPAPPADDPWPGDPSPADPWPVETVPVGTVPVDDFADPGFDADPGPETDSSFETDPSFDAEPLPRERPTDPPADPEPEAWSAEPPAEPVPEEWSAEPAAEPWPAEPEPREWPAEPVDDWAAEPEPEPEEVADPPTYDYEEETEPDFAPPPPRPLPDSAVRPAQILTSDDDDADGEPRLRVTVAGPRSARVGQDVRLIVRVENQGDGVAEAVTVSCPVPPGLRHPRGRTVRCPLGELGPGEVRTATFIARVTGGGTEIRPSLTVTARGGLVAKVAAPLSVAPAGGGGPVCGPVAVLPGR